MPMMSEASSGLFEQFVAHMNAAELALLPHKANEQHYEVPSAFYAAVLGEHRKYSSCFWPQGVSSLDDAEAAALAATCERARIENGQRILELGCGWGSLTLWMAEHYSASRITAVSNSHSQREYILREAARRGLQNVNIITCDMNVFTPMRVSTASCRSKCSNTCVTGAHCSNVCTAGWCRAGASSCTCSVTVLRHMNLSTAARPTGWAGIFFPAA